MEVWVVIGVLVAAYVVSKVVSSNRADQALYRRAQELSGRTGKRAEEIYHDMRRRKLTPGEWAMERGLDPMTFKPLDGAGAQPQGMWAALAKDPSEPKPDPVSLREIVDLHDSLMALFAEGIVMTSQIDRVEDHLRSLDRRGARFNVDVYRRGYESLPADKREQATAPKSQAEMDAWQARAVREAPSG